jgi:8-oxo-dGTP pyrophosphatase MutT (NUDIX family)
MGETKNFNTVNSPEDRPKLVYGAILLRSGLENKEDTNPFARKSEILLVKNRKTNEWHLPGGKYEDSDRSSSGTILRELKEELGIDLEYLYNQLYKSPMNIETIFIDFKDMPQFLQGQFLINTIYINFPLRATEIILNPKDTVVEYEWTSNPFENKDGTKRILTEHTTQVLTRLNY